MNKIKNTDQLHEEINRLKALSKQQEQQLKDDIQAIKEDLKPENILWSSLSSVTGIKISKSEFFKDGIAYGLSMLVQRFILKTEKKVEEQLYSLVDRLFMRIKDFLSRHTSHEARRNERQEDKD